MYYMYMYHVTERKIKLEMVLEKNHDGFRHCNYKRHINVSPYHIEARTDIFIFDFMVQFKLFTFKYMILPRSIFGIVAGD